MTQTLPWPLVCLNYVNPFRYMFRVQLQDIFLGFRIECTQQEVQKGLCLFSTGEQVLAYLKMDDNNLTRDILAVLGVCVFYRMLAWAVMVIRVRRYARK